MRRRLNSTTVLYSNSGISIDYIFFWSRLINMRREFLQLAHVYDEKKHGIAGWFASEKLDGMRALWDGGITRGLVTSTVPWANTEKDKNETVATGLWSRLGKPIYAPDWWLSCLPNYPLDGELWIERKGFQKLVSITKRTVNTLDTEWLDVKYMVFDCPSYEEILLPGTIKNPHYSKSIDEGVLDWVKKRTLVVEPPGSFKGRYDWLCKELTENRIVKVHEQVQLPHSTDKARDLLDKKLIDITSVGGEGIMLRAPHMGWFPKRNTNILKVKPAYDAEATVVGYRSGKGKHLGRMGALIVQFGNVVFDLAGFTDEERILSDPDWCRRYPGQVCDPAIKSNQFPVGSIVTFIYRELTDGGVPKEARYLR
jgi:DNA ligase-1